MQTYSQNQLNYRILCANGDVSLMLETQSAMINCTVLKWLDDFNIPKNQAIITKSFCSGTGIACNPQGLLAISLYFSDCAFS